MPLNRHLAGLDAWTGLRRDQWASRTNIRKIEIDHDHGGIVKLNPLAEWTEEETWDYIHEHDLPVHPLYAQGYTSIGCAPCTRAIQPGEAFATAAGRGSRALRRSAASTARSRAAASSTSSTRCSRRPLDGRRLGEVADVLRAEAQAVLAMVLDEGHRGTLADVIAAVDEGKLDASDARPPSSCSSSVSSTGASALSTGPRPRRRPSRSCGRLPRGRAAAESAREVSEALSSLEGRLVEQISVHVLSPGEFTVSIGAGGLELTARLGRAGVRLDTNGA